MLYLNKIISMMMSAVYGKIEMQKKGSKSAESGLGRDFKSV